MSHPLTQREIKQEKYSQTIVEYTTIMNVCKQMIPIQLKSPDGVDFFIGEQTTVLMPGKLSKFPSMRLYWDQIQNHQKAGRIRVISA